MGKAEENYSVKDVDVRNYAKYVLREGKDVEKRELLGCLKSGVGLKNKGIYLISDTNLELSTS
jgi:hypothetical protein